MGIFLSILIRNEKNNMLEQKSKIRELSYRGIIFGGLYNAFRE